MTRVGLKSSVKQNTFCPIDIQSYNDNFLFLLTSNASLYISNLYAKQRDDGHLIYIKKRNIFLSLTFKAWTCMCSIFLQLKIIFNSDNIVEKTSRAMLWEIITCIYIFLSKEFHIPLRIFFRLDCIDLNRWVNLKRTLLKRSNVVHQMLRHS